MSPAPGADEPTLAPPAKKRNAAGSSRNGGLGEIVEVQGGHILRSTGRKDRHSKVCTAKGPRDRRVRLAAHTAIQFYDVQDRLGFDRPSKAVDWLITKAKSAIDQLDQLPPWKPTAKTRPTDTSILPPPSLNSGDIPANFSGSHSQDLKLSLQSFQDPILHSQLGFDGMFMAPPMYGHGGHFFSQRGPLQSSNSPAIRAWTGDNGVGSSAGDDYHQGISLAGIGYANSSGYSGFHIPARIQGDDEDHDDGNHNNPSSASSGSRH